MSTLIIIILRNEIILSFSCGFFEVYFESFLTIFKGFLRVFCGFYESILRVLGGFLQVFLIMVSVGETSGHGI
jgi:hypothetical protein